MRAGCRSSRSRARAASTASSPRRTARSPSAWKCAWNPRASSCGTASAEDLGLDERHAPVVGRRPVGREVRLEHRRRVVLDDPVEHQLDARRGVAADRSLRPPLDERLDLLEAPRRAPTTARPTTLRRELAATGDAQICRPGRRASTPASCQFVIPSAVEVAPGSRAGRGRSSSAAVVRDQAPRPGPARPRGACRAACRPRRGRSGRRAGSGVSAVMPGELQGPAVDPRVVAVAVLQEHRAIRDDPVEVLAPGEAAREVGERPAAAEDPRRPRDGPRRTRRSLAGSSSRPRARGGRTGGGRRPDVIGWTWASPNPGVTVRPRRSMTRVDGPARGMTSRVAADRDDPVAPDGDGLGPAVGGVGGEDLAAGEDEIGAIGRFGMARGCTGRGNGSSFVRRARRVGVRRATLRAMTDVDLLHPGTPATASPHPSCSSATADALIVVDPGHGREPVPDPGPARRPGRRARGGDPRVPVSHHHPDHTINCALFPERRGGRLLGALQGRPVAGPRRRRLPACRRTRSCG